MSEVQILKKQLTDRRQALGLSQRDLAKAMSTTQSHVCDLENNRNDTTLRVMERWAKALGLKLTVSLDDTWDDGRPS